MNESVVRQLIVDGAEIVVLADEDSVAREAAARTVAALRAALEARGSAHLALTGGSSAIPLYRVLAADPWRHAIPWHEVHLWWGDERFVPRDHPESNSGLAYRILLAIGAHSGESGTGAEGVDVLAGDVPGLPVDADKVHPIPAEEAIADGLDTHWAAQAYADEIERLVPKNAAGVPAFDAILLGIGPDGHTLSVFPGSPALGPTAPIVVATPAPEHVEPHLPRVTLSARVLAAAGAVIVMASGSGKQEVLGRILGAERDPARWPAQAAILPNAVWLLDEAVAARVGAS
ncbi:MAG: 6-phosphogluconolactonase [Chloroflexota bacterium]